MKQEKGKDFIIIRIVVNKNFEKLIEMKKVINSKLSSTGGKKYETPYVNTDGIVDIKYKDNLDIMIRRKLLSSDACHYLIDYDVDEEDIIED